MQVKVLSWNIWVDGDLDAVVEFIQNANADIIGLQEVIPERQPNILKCIEGLGYQSIFSSVTETRKDGKKMGNAILSRYEIVDTKTHVLGQSINRTSSEDERRIVLQAEIRLSGTTLHVFTTHLAHTHQKRSDIQDKQVENLIKLLPQEKTIVAGDFNATPDSSVILKMRNILNDTDLGGSPTWSIYPAGCEVCNPQALDTRLDYIFTTKDLKAHSATVGKSKASDHLPISVVVDV